MEKKLYQFNQKTLSYEKAKVSVRDVVKRVVWLLLTALSFALLLVWLFFSFLSSPKEKLLQKENQELKVAIDNINSQLSVMEIVLHDIQNRDDQVYRALFEVDPIPIEKRNPFLNEDQSLSEIKSTETMAMLNVAEEKVVQLIYQLNLQQKSLDTMKLLVEDKNALLRAIPAIRPIKMMYAVNSGFGRRFHPILKTMRPHTGVDIAAPRGTPVYATADGIVVNNKAISGYGITVTINHGFSYTTLYAHLSKKAVRVGQKVTRGELIGYVGNTGVSLGSHLHYEVRKDNVPVNPVHYFFHDITPEEYEAILESSNIINQALS